MLFSTFGKLSIILIFFEFSSTNGYSIKQKSRDELEEPGVKTNSEWWIKKKIRTLERELAQFEEIFGKYLRLLQLFKPQTSTYTYALVV